MKRTYYGFFVVLMLSLFAFAGWSLAQDDAESTIMVVELRGTAVGEVQDVIEIEGTGTTEGLCFEVEIWDITSDTQIGTATDCLSDVEPDENGSIALTATTTFNFEGGSITARGLTTVQAVTQDTGDTGITHITGAFPSDGENSIIDSTGIFEDAQGAVRLSGAANLSNLADATEMSFSCIFIIQLDGSYDV